MPATADESSQRRTVYYAGRVQGVGFRWTTHRIAKRHAVTGFVQNLDDGRVQVVAEGPSEELDRFFAAIEQAMAGKIASTQVSRSAATGEYSEFSIDH